MAVCLAYLIQWLLFIPAYVFQTEKFYDLSGGLTYITVVIFSLAVTSNSGINLANLIIAIFIIIWAIRLSSFLFLRISKDGEDKRFRSIKPNLTQFFMTWTLQGMWVSLCSMCALTAINTGRLEVMNIFFIIGACIFVTGLYIEIKADNQKADLEVFQKIEIDLLQMVYGLNLDIQTTLAKFSYGQALQLCQYPLLKAYNI